MNTDVLVSHQVKPPAAVPEEMQCLQRLFEAQAARTPEATAIVFDGETLTYNSLNARANRLARRLRDYGVGPDVIVGISAARSFEMVVGLFAILKAGGAYLPLDPEYPAERLDFMLADAGVEILLTQRELAPRLPPFAGRVITLESDETLYDRANDADLTHVNGPDDLAYVIYTSGSTGKPKGVMLAHRGACNNLAWRQETFPLSSDDRLLQTYSFSFDPSVWAFFWPLSAGAAIILPRSGDHGDPARLNELILEHQVTVAGFSPSLLDALLDQSGPSSLDSLCHVFSGGEPLTSDLAARFYAAAPFAELHNVYGPTEATIDSTWWTCPRIGIPDTIPIGHPLTNTQVYLLDEQGAPVPDGSAGELHVAGVGLARGYLNRAELSSDRFIVNPFADDRAAYPILYRTGDLTKRGADGAIYYLGRIDDQVKIRGFRIELGEIESVLSRHPHVRGAAVQVCEDKNGKRLVAYVVPASQAFSKEELRSWVADKLPAHMSPSAFVCIDRVPLSPNGKLNRKALPAPDASDWDRQGARVAPRTALEEQLVALFENLLGVSPLGIEDDFFEWGGHSLLAARLITEAERLTGRRLALPDVASGATAERLAALLSTDHPSEQLPPQIQRWNFAAGSTPFFFWHGDFTGGFYCGKVCKGLGSDQTVYTLSPHGTFGTTILPTIEEMARDFINQLRTVQASGPYRLGGYCNGGLVAYEVARQLVEQGEEIELLALIELDMPIMHMKLWLNRHVCRIGRQIGLGAPIQQSISLMLQGSSVPVSLALKRLRRSWEKMQRLLNPDPGPDWGEIIPEAYRRKSAYYRLRPYPGRVLLLWADQELETPFGHPSQGWSELVGELVFDTTPGTHGDCQTIHAQELGARLRTYLDGVPPHAAGRPVASPE